MYQTNYHRPSNLAEAGVGDFDMPATPERVWRALRNAQ